MKISLFRLLFSSIQAENGIMSQKYKNFSRGSGSDSNSVLPPDVKRVGYLRKLKVINVYLFQNMCCSIC